MTEFRTYEPKPVPCREHVELIRSRTGVVGLSPEQIGKVVRQSAQYGGEITIEVDESQDHDVHVSHKLADATSKFTASTATGLSYQKTAPDGSIVEQWVKPIDEDLSGEETFYVDYPLMLMIDVELSQDES